jgi:hypothetical protein
MIIFVFPKISILNQPLSVKSLVVGNLGLAVLIAAWVFVLELRIMHWIPTECKIIKKGYEAGTRGYLFPVLFYKYEVNGRVYVSDKIKMN